MELKLYAFQPEGHGSLSFFTVATSKAEAKKVVDKHVKENHFANGKPKYEASGWGTSYYKLTVVDVGKVIENDND